MERIAKFHKVSMQQFEKDWSAAFPEVTATEIQRIYEELRLPVRATRGSAGYDFFAPAAFTLKPRETLKIPTGIRAEIQEGWVLQLFPRSSLGFTYRLQFNNTVGIIDSDYFESDNEGHIFIKLMIQRRGKSYSFAQTTALHRGFFFRLESVRMMLHRNSVTAALGVRINKTALYDAEDKRQFQKKLLAYKACITGR